MKKKIELENLWVAQLDNIFLTFSPFLKKKFKIKQTQKKIIKQKNEGR